MKKTRDYTIELLLAIFLFCCLVSCSNKVNISKGKKPQNFSLDLKHKGKIIKLLPDHLIKGNAIHFQQRKDAKERKKLLLLTTKY